MLYSKTGQKLAVCLTASAFASLLSAASSAAVIYENSEAFTGQVTPGIVNGVGIGDIVGFAGTERTLTSVSFEYFLSPTRSGNETAQFNIYALDGGTVDGTTLPSTLLYTSPAFSISTGTTAEGYGTFDIENLAVALPDSVAWTVTFGGLDAGESAGLLFHNDLSPVGTNPTFLDPVTTAQEQFSVRRNSDGTWDLLNHDGVVDNFSVQFQAVPEPTTWALMLGGLAMMGFLRRRK